MFSQAGLKLCLFINPSTGFWMDVGQPKDFIIGATAYLNHARKENTSILAKGDCILGNVLVHETATIGHGCQIGPDVVIGPNCVIEDGK